MFEDLVGAGAPRMTDRWIGVLMLVCLVSYVAWVVIVGINKRGDK